MCDKLFVDVCDFDKSFNRYLEIINLDDQFYTL